MAEQQAGLKNIPYQTVNPKANMPGSKPLATFCVATLKFMKNIFLNHRMPAFTSIFISWIFVSSVQAQLDPIDVGNEHVGLLPYGISSDGSAIVGLLANRSYPFSSAYMWTPSTGIQVLSGLEALQSYALDVSGDGEVVVGSSSRGAFIWTAGEGLETIYESDVLSVASRISNDGNVVVGTRALNDLGTIPYRWTRDLGVQDLGFPFPEADIYQQSYIRGVSGDGSTIVGDSTGAGGERRVFIWRETEGLSDLNDLPGWKTDAWPSDISSDGKNIIGVITVPSDGTYSYVWSAQEGSVHLGHLSDSFKYTLATAVSSDGSVVVGGSYTLQDYEGFRWSQETGMLTVSEWLRQSGHDIGSDVFLGQASAVSADGSVVAGEIYHSETIDSSSWIARGNSGLITLDEFTASFGTTASIPQVTNALPSTILNGSHHRVLLLHPQLDNENSFWVNGDFAHHGRRDADLSVGEAGMAHDFGPELRGGIGLGWGHLDQDLTFGGRHELDGQYLVAELDWNIEGTPLILSATGVYGDWDADIKRGYLNGGTPDQSRGSTDVETLSLRLRADWLDLFELGQVSFTPHISYTLTRIESDAYVETGGGFPVAFNSQSHMTEEIRLGLTGETSISDKTKLRGIFEGVYRIDDNNAGFSGQVIGLFGFSIPGAKNNQEWVRIGAEIEHQIDENKIITATVFGSTRGEDPELSTAVNFRINF